MENYESKTKEELVKEREELVAKYEYVKQLIAEKERTEKQIKEKKLKEEKDARYKEVSDFYKKTCELASAYIKDYGSIRFNDKDGNSIFAPFWNKFFF